MRVHQEEKKYLCPECGYKCKWATQLKYHMTKHTGISKTERLMIILGHFLRFDNAFVGLNTWLKNLPLSEVCLSPKTAKVLEMCFP